MPATIVVSLLNATSAYHRLLRTDAEESARRHRFALEVYECADETTTQVRQLRDCIRRDGPQRPYAVVVFPARDRPMERLADEIVKAGVGCVVLNRRAEYLDALHRHAPELPVAIVGPDQTEVGRLQAQQAQALMPSAGYVLYVLGVTLASSTRERRAGFREGLAGTKIKIGEVVGNWSADEADHAVGAWLEAMMRSRLPLGLVACQNDAMAVGSRRALGRVAKLLDRPELARLPVTGVDGLADDGRKQVDEGMLTATIVLPPSTGEAIQLLARKAKGEAVPASVAIPIASYPALPALAAARRA